MLTVTNNGIIQLTRGDSCSMPLFINQGSISAPMRFELSKNPDAIVTFAITYPNQFFEQGFFKRVYTKQNWELNEEGDLLIKFMPQDTRCVMPGKYFYQVKLDIDGKGNINTIIPTTEFWIV